MKNGIFRYDRFMHPDLTNHPNILLVLAVAFPLCLVSLLAFLGAMFRREAVKRDLLDRGIEPLRIWWVPFSWRGPYTRTRFHVRYRDESGLLHKAICCVHVDLMDNPFFGERHVRWYKDIIKGEL